MIKCNVVRYFCPELYIIEILCLATVEVLDILRIIQYSKELSVILILIAFKIQSLMSYGEENQAKVHKNLKEETSKVLKQICMDW